MFAPDLPLAPGGQDPGHTPVSPTEALGAHLVPELRRAVFPGLPALPQIRPIPCEAAPVAGATSPLGEPLPCEPVTQRALCHPDLLGDDRPGVALVPQRPSPLILGQPLGTPGRPGHISARSYGGLWSLQDVERRRFCRKFAFELL